MSRGVELYCLRRNPRREPLTSIVNCTNPVPITTKPLFLPSSARPIPV